MGKPSAAPQQFAVNQPNPHHCTNEIRTSKYTLWPWALDFFLWKNLFEQFQRVANLYFLLIAALQLVPGLSPTGTYTTLATLVVVLAFSALKAAVEDYGRHRGDARVNSRTAHVLCEAGWSTTLWRDIQLGSLVKVEKGSEFPADIITVATSEEEGMAYVETANLDGETNLKPKRALAETLSWTEPGTLAREAVGEMHTEAPNNSLYTFTGKWELPSRQALPLGPDSLLLRGSQLRKAEWICGVVVFIGQETKMMQNATKPPHKQSSMERSINHMLLYIVVEELFFILLCSGLAIAFDTPPHWYLDSYPKKVTLFFISLPTFLILFNALIPISLYVSMEMVKAAQGFFIDEDVGMYFEPRDMPAMAHTTSLNEELGQVDSVFSDKTGTLTCNMMSFFKFSVAGVAYGSGTTEIGRAAAKRQGRPLPEEPQREAQKFQFVDARVDGGQWRRLPHAAHMERLFTLLAVCHTVITERDNNGQPRFQAESPDEAALVEAAVEFGFRFLDRKAGGICLISALGVEQTWRVLNVLEFNSDRKRMSVICRAPDGNLMLYCKGADNVMFARMVSDACTAETANHLRAFGEEGLRTLVCGWRSLVEEAYGAWNARFQAARAIVGKDRDVQLAALAEEVEVELQLVGATAIEDKLQMGVPECIEGLRTAGIRVWVLTGDKQETAINIGFACALLHNDMECIILNHTTAESIETELKAALAAHMKPKAGSQGLAVVIDGACLVLLLQKEGLRADFFALACLCQSVICCRVSPLQKAEVVKLVRKLNKQAVTLAIGDGANDVSMIQAAHVGVGISGMEGQQAANSSDYAIGQFRFLFRLLFIHGRWNYRRLALLICYSFYKNAVLFLIQFFFCFANAYTGQSLFDSWVLAAYNVFFTSIPILVVGAIDRDISDEQSFRDHPTLYENGLKNLDFNTKVFLGWFVNSIYHAVICFVFPLYALAGDQDQFSNGKAIGMDGLGVTVYTVVVLVVNLKAGLECQSWTWLHHFAIWGSILVWYIFMMVYGTIFSLSPAMWGMIIRLYKLPQFWLVSLLTPVIALLRDVLWKYYCYNLRSPDKLLTYQRLRIMEAQRVCSKRVAEAPGPSALSAPPSNVDADSTSPSANVTSARQVVVQTMELTSVSDHPDP
eukprot:GGOE01001505.1.p1 GENE.GGOE01001505.1~~GGOE01001505.1.p1  ORF type:complete len:1133 (-),score=369.93 GGOE01001505.1:261-3659(-)